MRSEDFREAVTGIREDYIVDALENEMHTPKKKNARRARILALSFAAAILTAALALTLIFAA